MPSNPNQTFTIKPDSLVYGGEAFGRLPDERAVFVPFVIPNEEVEVRLVEEKRGFARAELINVLDKSQIRIKPRCIHFMKCGGCHYQHMPYEYQLDSKRMIVKEQLERLGQVSNPTVSPTVCSTNPFNYRNYVQFHLSPDGLLGFHKMRSNEILLIEECHLPQELLNTIWQKLEVETIPGLERISFRIGYDEEIQLILESSDQQIPSISIEELPISAVHLCPAGRIVLAGSLSITFQVADRFFQVSADSFFQVNTDVANKMVDYLLKTIPKYHTLNQSSILLDAYCGVGLFSAFFAPVVGRLISVESSPSACDDFEINLEEFDNVELYQAPVEQVLPHLDFQPDILFVDPPRKGLSHQVIDEIIKLQPPLLVYISCDPATLSRDTKRLTRGGYRLDSITPFDMFPQTYHIESISFLTW
jgi:23S rRNA (uracil1939-C5)-methyltransferase